MFFWNRFPFVRFILALASGVFCAYHLPLAVPWLWQLVVSTLAAVVFVLYLTHKIVNPGNGLRFATGLAGISLLFFYGAMVVAAKQEQQKISIRQHTAIPKISAFTGVVISAPESKRNHYQMVLRLAKVKNLAGWQSLQGKVQLLVKKTEHQQIKYGQSLVVVGTLEAARPPLNDWDFNYKQYLADQGILFLHYTAPERVVVFNRFQINRVQGKATQLRQVCDSILSTYISSADEYGIATALLLGTKTSIDETLKLAYTNSGISHVLAVSGCHVLLLYGTLLLCFGWIKKYTTGKIIFVITALAIIWFYGFVTGLTPSVMRAIVMCTFMIVAGLLKRKANIYNTLSASAFFLICFDPFLLMNVGFLLSYAAVLGIATLHPLIYHLMYCRFWMADKIWSLISVTLAAQVATFPLLLCYFHQFPLLFLHANIIAIPATTIVLYASSILVGAAPYAPVQVLVLLGKSIESLLQWLHTALLWLQQIPSTTISEINTRPVEILFLYTIMATMILFYHQKKYWMLRLLVLQVMFYSLIIIQSKYALDKQKKIVIYKTEGAPMLALICGRSMTLFSNDSTACAFVKRKHAAQLATLGIKKIKNFNTDNKITLAMKKCEGFTYHVWQGRKILLQESSQPLERLPVCDIFVNTTTAIPLNLQPSTSMVMAIGKNNNQWRKINLLEKQLALPVHNLTTQGVFVKTL